MEIKGKDNYDVAFTVNGTVVSLDGHAHDHNALTNYDANEHVDHSGVVLTAGIGLVGGGDLTAGRTFDFDIPELSIDATPDGAADYMMTYDASAATHKKVLLENRPGGAGGGGSTYVEHFTVLQNPASYDSWYTITIPGIMGPCLLEVLVSNLTSTISKNGGVREVGSTNSRYSKIDMGAHIPTWVNANASNQIQVYREHGSISYRLIGEHC